MEHTEGLGRLAEVWVDGHLLYVCDGVSDPGRRVPAGVIENARFTYVTTEGLSWQEAVADNRARKRQLDHVRKWSYSGYGRVRSIMPVVVDFGLLEMEDANWTNDEGLIGQFVRIPIDRLEIGRAGRPKGGTQ